VAGIEAGRGEREVVQLGAEGVEDVRQGGLGCPARGGHLGEPADVVREQPAVREVDRRCEELDDLAGSS
jgi:hypothetical protein